jgi:hypothetical protein
MPSISRRRRGQIIWGAANEKPTNGVRRQDIIFFGKKIGFDTLKEREREREVEQSNKTNRWSSQIWKIFQAHRMSQQKKSPEIKFNLHLCYNSHLIELIEK